MVNFLFNSRRLETTLRNFSCLTTGDSIMVAYNNKKYYIDIIESKPASAITIIETDCEVDFAPPLDYKEPERVPAVPAPAAKTTATQGLQYLAYILSFHLLPSIRIVISKSWVL
jgi:ubiquitin fusion degradation protein 1